MAAKGFCIMQYECKKCGDVEKIYNARGGVTPYLMRCRKCGGESRHVRWNEDIRDTEYTPEPGQRVFFSMPLELARLYARRNLKHWEESDHPPPAEGTEERKELYESLVDDYYHDGEAPCIFTM